MRKLLKLLLVLFALLEISAGDNGGVFTVVGSSLLKFRDTYRASVVYSGYDQDYKLRLSVKTKEHAKNQTDFEVHRDVVLSGSGNKIVDFDLKNQPEGHYVFEATGDNFTAFKKLNLNTKTASTFIQTDKATYKPSDLVKFRVLRVDGETKPLPLPESAKLEIFVSDGASNRVKQFDGPRLSKFGVFQGELQLSDSPVLGSWRLSVRIDGEDAAEKAFEVAEYVLPKFEVKLDVNEDANFVDGKIRAKVNARYTFGKVAKGNATVTAKVPPFYGWWRHRPGQQHEAKTVSKTVRVDGKEVVEFDVKEELGLSKDGYRRNVELTATFTEELSGKEVNASARVEVHDTRHRIEMTRENGERIKPGLPFRVTAHVKHHERSAPVTDRHNPLKFVVSYTYEVPRTCRRRLWPHHRITPYYESEVMADSDATTTEEVPTTTTTEVPTTTTAAYEEYECREEKSYEKEFEVFLKNGVASIDLDIPGNTTNINVKAKYLETSHDHFYVRRAESESGRFIQARLQRAASLSDQVAVEVLSNEEIEQLTYQVFGKGSLIDSRTVSFAPTKRHVLTFTPTPAMVPKALVIVFYVTAGGEIVSDRADVEFSGDASNFLELKLSKETAKPGEDLQIAVSTKPNSFVGLLGVDQSVLLLKSGNDIEQADVDRELTQYGEPTMRNYEWYGSEYYEFSRYDDFDDTDTVILTNARKQFERAYIPYYYDHDEGDIVLYAERGDAPMYAAALDSDAPVAHKTTTLAMPGLPGPPLAQAFGAQANRVGAAPPARPIAIRKEFPETWLFEELEFDAAPNATRTLSKKVPDTITSWIVTGFSVDPATGLALTKQPSRLNVFQPFFAATNLPYSIKRGEVVAVPVVVFNYLAVDQRATVTLFNEDRDFEFVEVADDENRLTRRKRALESARAKTVEAKANDGTAVSFMIRPLKVGQIAIKVVVEAEQAGDGLEKLLRVEPEGVTQFKNEAVLIDLRSADTFRKTIDIEVPANAVEDSTRIEASAIGDVLGPTIENLNNLIKMPYGCGEQNMLNFVPNIVVLEYLATLKKLTPEVEERCKRYMEVGYQKELTYRHDDGSYSAFGKSDKSGSTWLTAFVARSFSQAAKHIHVDAETVTQALDYLAGVQAPNGSFPELGHVSHKDMQGGASEGVALTAYTLLALLESEKASGSAGKYRNTTDRAVAYVADNLEHLHDNYSLAIASYALQLAKHPKSDAFLAKLDARAEKKDGTTFWTKEEAADEGRLLWQRLQPNSVNVEMSAYALQALLEAGRETDAVPVMKWLVSQRNSAGGFQSTQDTVVGLQALSRLAGKIYVPQNRVQISVRSGDGREHAKLSLDDGNALMLQKHQLPANERRFEVEATGRGFSVLQISYRFNVGDSGKFPRFKLAPKVMKEESNKEFLQLQVCTSFVPNAQDDRSNMAVMEVALPSGFTFDADSLEDLMDTERVKKVETKDGETVVMVYFDDIDNKDLCPVFKAYRTHAVAKQKPSPVIIYDYYDNTRHARAFYNPPEVSLCDICQGESECKDACEVPTPEIN